MARQTVRPQFWLIVSLLGIAGCWSDPPEPKLLSPGSDPFGGYPPVEFKDEVTSTQVLPPETLEMTFIDSKGQNVDLTGFRGKKNLVLVFTRGFYGRICPYCTTQTSRLIANYDKFQELDAEVLVVYPGEKAHLPDFLAAVKANTEPKGQEFPFPVLLDPDFKAVDALVIRGSLAWPSTYIIDKEGRVRLAYVGSSDGDRPSIKAMLSQLEAANGQK